MVNKINAIVLAGTHGAEPFEIDGKKIRKQYIEICGKTIIERVVDAVLDAKLIDKVYVVGNTEELTVYLKDKPKERCIFVEQYTGVMNNILETFLRHICYDTVTDYKNHESRAKMIDKYRNLAEDKVFVIHSDLLFPSATSIDELISQCDDMSDIECGLTNKDAFDDFLERNDVKDYDENINKTAFTPVGEFKLRFNNMLLLKPLKMPVALYNLIQEVYENRFLIDYRGNVKVEVWKKLANLYRRYARDSGGSSLYKKFIVYRGFINGLIACAFLHRAKNRDKGYWITTMKDGEKYTTWFTGMKARYIITDSLSVIDLDMPGTYNYFKEKGVFDRVYSSEKQGS